MGHVAVIHALLAHPKIDVNKAVEALLTPQDQDIKVNLPRNGDIAPLHIAIYMSNVAAIQALLAHPKIDVNQATDEENATPLSIATEDGNINVVNTLLNRHDIKVNIPRKDGATPLFIAAQYGQIDMVRALLDHKDIEVNNARNDGATPLLIATQEGKIDVVKALLKHRNINVNQAAKDGATPLVIAIQKGKIDVVNALLAHLSFMSTQVSGDGSKQLDSNGVETEGISPQSPAPVLTSLSIFPASPKPLTEDDNVKISGLNA